MTPFIRVARRAHAVKRYHTEHTIGYQTIADHSYGVAMLVLYLSNGEPSMTLMKEALYHDLAEQHTGDTPAPAKWDSSALTKALNAMEERWHRENGVHLGVLTQAETVLLKWADSLELMCYCLEQRKLGNTYAEEPFYKVVEFLSHFYPNELGWDLLGQLVNEMKEVRNERK